MDEASKFYRLLMEAEDHAIAIRNGFRRASGEPESRRAWIRILNAGLALIVLGGIAAIVIVAGRHW